MNNHQNGNVFVYILIAVALLGGLMFALSKSSSQEQADGRLTQGQRQIVAGEIISYASSATNTLIQMQQSDIQNAQIDFMLPSDIHFNDSPTIYKFFHPDGGGLNYKPLPKTASADDGAGLTAGYYVGRFNSTEWTPTTTFDVMFAAYEINEVTCQELNRKIIGNTTIPTVTGETLENLFVFDDFHTGTNNNFNATHCAACEERPSLCVTNGSGKYVFYNIIDAE